MMFAGSVLGLRSQSSARETLDSAQDQPGVGFLGTKILLYTHQQPIELGDILSSNPKLGIEAAGQMNGINDARKRCDVLVEHVLGLVSSDSGPQPHIHERLDGSANSCGIDLHRKAGDHTRALQLAQSLTRRGQTELDALR